MNNTYSILIIEDRAEIAARLSKVVSKDERLEVIGVASSLAEGLKILTENKPRVVLIDLVDLSRNCAAPLTAYYALKENTHGTKTNNRI